MTTGSISDNLRAIRESIVRHAVRAGRNPEEISLVAVSKYIHTSQILEAYEAGQRDFGENRVQELKAKKRELPEDIRWHLIGHLQTNKARVAVSSSCLIHSVDSLRLLSKINDIGHELDKQQEILIQVNVSGEISKAGIREGSVTTLLESSIELPNVLCKGFMTMAPFDASNETLSMVFGTLQRLRDRIQDQYSMTFPELSMGMSGDYRIAIKKGATLIRIGTAIFGSRN